VLAVLAAQVGRVVDHVHVVQEPREDPSDPLVGPDRIEEGAFPP
jgi:hypothetical protein